MQITTSKWTIQRQQKSSSSPAAVSRASTRGTILSGRNRLPPFSTKHFLFSLWAVSNSTLLESEQLIYPLTSLVAEFGGLLGLFFGFSFMTIWDGLNFLKPWFAKKNCLVEITDKFIKTRVLAAEGLLNPSLSKLIHQKIC